MNENCMESLKKTQVENGWADQALVLTDKTRSICHHSTKEIVKPTSVLCIFCKSSDVASIHDTVFKLFCHACYETRKQNRHAKWMKRKNRSLKECSVCLLAFQHSSKSVQHKCHRCHVFLCEMCGVQCLDEKALAEHKANDCGQVELEYLGEFSQQYETVINYSNELPPNVIVPSVSNSESFLIPLGQLVGTIFCPTNVPSMNYNMIIVQPGNIVTNGIVTDTNAIQNISDKLENVTNSVHDAPNKEPENSNDKSIQVHTVGSVKVADSPEVPFSCTKIGSKRTEILYCSDFENHNCCTIMDEYFKQDKKFRVVTTQVGFTFKEKYVTVKNDNINKRFRGAATLASVTYKKKDINTTPYNDKSVQVHAVSSAKVTDSLELPLSYTKVDSENTQTLYNFNFENRNCCTIPDEYFKQHKLRVVSTQVDDVNSKIDSIETPNNKSSNESNCTNILRSVLTNSVDKDPLEFTIKEENDEKVEGSDMIIDKCVVYGVDVSNENKEFNSKNIDSVFKSFAESRVFEKEEQKTAQVKGVGNKDKRFVCTICNFVFKSNRNLKSHYQIHTGIKPFICEVCGMGFVRQQGLQSHYRKHSSARPYSCDRCNKSYKDRYVLDKHKMTHDNIRPFKCDICNKDFVCRTSLVNHKKYHSDKRPYNCHICSKSFNFQATLRCHIKTHEGQDLETSCLECKEEFQVPKDLYEHVQEVHKDELLYVYTGTEKKAEKKERVKHGKRKNMGRICNVCNKEFKNSTSLRLHTYTHTGERPYICEVCNRGFTQKGSLDSHFRIHTGEKPYMCKICGKRFTTNTVAITHVERHRGKQLLHCPVCYKTFVTRSTQRGHIKRFHRGKN